jgi:8-oxo-dGTP pyrophosphatase MutT (NUDIX family)
MRETARGIVFKDGGIILIHRIKEKEGKLKEYYVFPGGGIENGETHFEAVIREVLEETGVTVKPIKEIYHVVKDENIHNYILCEYVSGEMGTGEGPEFNSEEYSNSGEYIPEIIKIEELDKLDVQQPLAEAIQKDIEEYKSLENAP